MANWEATFTQPLSFNLENGLLGNASDMASAITQFYVSTLLTGQLPKVPPTLPAPALSGAPAPVGGIVTINGYEARQRLFFETLRIYYEGRALLQGKANIQDLIVSYRRLIRKSRILREQIRSNVRQAQLVARELVNLPQTLAEMIQLLIEYIKERLNEIRELPNLFDSFRLELDEVTFESLFRQELNLINEVANFNPTANPRDYRRFALLLTEVGKNIDRLQYDLSSPATIKAYVYRKIQGVIGIIMRLVEGFTNPTVIIDILEDIARIERKYRRVVLIARLFIRRSATLRDTQKRLKAQQKKLKDELDGIIKPKTEAVKALIKERTNEYTNQLLKFKQSGVILSVSKKVKQEGQTKQKRIKKAASAIRRIRRILRLLVNLILKIDSLSIGVKRAIEELESTAANLQINTSGQATQTSNQLRKLIRNDLGIKDLGILNSITSIAVQYRLSLDDIKYLILINTNNIEQLYKEAASIIEVDIPELKRALRETQGQTKPKTKIKKSVSLLDMSNLFGFLKAELKEIQIGLNRRIKDLTLFIDKQKQDLKIFVTEYTNNLKELNANLNQKLNRKRQKEGELIDKKKRAEERKRLLQKIACGARFTISATRVAVKANAPGFTLSDNQGDIDKMLREYYLFLKLDYQLSPEESARQLQAKRLQFTKLLQTELLYKLVQDLINEINSGDLLEELTRVVQDKSLELGSEFTTTYNTLLNIFKPGQNRLDAIEALNFSVLNNINFVQDLYRLEQRYLRKFKQTIRTIRDTQQGSFIQNKTLNKFYNSVDKVRSVILFLFELIIEAAKAVRDFVLSLVRPAIQKINTRIEEAKRKQAEKAQKDAEAQVEKRVNLEAITLSATLNVATRLFWTGFSWTTPVGTTFIVTNIGLFGGLKLLPVNGARGYASELATNFQQQLLTLSGTVIPNPSTGIPSFPFVGLI